MTRGSDDKSTARRRLIGIAAIAGIAAVVSTGLVTACGGPHCGHRGADPARMESFALWHVNETLDELDATEAQRRVILDRTRAVVRDAIALHDSHDDGHEVVRAELATGAPEADRLHALLDDRLDEVRAFGHRTIDRALEAYETLDADQRDALLAELEDHFDSHRRR